MTRGRVILAGGSGFIGAMLARDLIQREYEAVILSRSAARQKSPNVRNPIPVTFHWDGRTIGDWAACLEGARAVINLAGRSVNCRHTEKNRHEIIESRVDSVKVVADAVDRCRVPPRVWIQAGGEGVYGDWGDGCCDENTPPGGGFLVDICKLWEQAFNQSETPRTRHVLIRIGFVLGAEGGALKTMARLTRWGLGGTAGNGQQFVNWIHGSDLGRIFLAAIEDEGMQGVFNASGPKPATNAEFMRELRRAVHRPWSPPAPAWAVRLGAWLMGSDGRLALTGRCCMPKRLLDQKFKFDFPELRGALASFYGDTNDDGRVRS
jgi:uncharacterized protein (TIGR01777 family)